MDALLTPSEVAGLLQIHPSTLTRLRQRGDGPTVVWVTGRAPRYRLAAVLAFIQAREAVI